MSTTRQDRERAAAIYGKHRSPRDLSGWIAGTPTAWPEQYEALDTLAEAFAAARRETAEACAQACETLDVRQDVGTYRQGVVAAVAACRKIGGGQ